MTTKPRSKRPTAPTSVAIYVRLSVDKSGEGAGVARQEESARLLAQAKGWTVSEVYSDNDASATSKKPRPSFERLLTDIAAGRVQAVLCWHLDRLVRKMSDLVRIIEAGKDAGLNIATVHGVSLDMGDPTGIAVAQILTAIAGMEVAHKGARQQAGNEQRATAGRASTTRAFGYDSDGTVREAEAVFVKELFAKFVAGAPISELTAWMSGSGMGAATARVRTDGRWSRTGIRRLLTNRRYLGEVWYRGEFVRMGTWTPLVDADTFAAAGARLADPTRTTTTGPNRKHLGVSLYRCGLCAAAGVDTTLISLSSLYRRPSGEKVSYQYYRCPLGGNKTHLSRRLDLVDPIVKAEISRVLNGPATRGAFAADRNVNEVRALRDKAAALRLKEDEYALELDKDDPDLTPRQVKVLTAKARERLVGIEATLVQLGQRSALAAVAGASDPAAAWKALDVHQAAAVVDALAVVTIQPQDGRVFDPSAITVASR